MKPKNNRTTFPKRWSTWVTSKNFKTMNISCQRDDFSYYRIMQSVKNQRQNAAPFSTVQQKRQTVTVWTTIMLGPQQQPDLFRILIRFRFLQLGSMEISCIVKSDRIPKTEIYINSMGDPARINLWKNCAFRVIYTAFCLVATTLLEHLETAK